MHLSVIPCAVFGEAHPEEQAFLLYPPERRGLVKVLGRYTNTGKVVSVLVQHADGTREEVKPGLIGSAHNVAATPIFPRHREAPA